MKTFSKMACRTVGLSLLVVCGTFLGACGSNSAKDQYRSRSPMQIERIEALVVFSVADQMSSAERLQYQQMSVQQAFATYVGMDFQKRAGGIDLSQQADFSLLGMRQSSEMRVASHALELWTAQLERIVWRNTTKFDVVYPLADIKVSAHQASVDILQFVIMETLKKQAIAKGKVRVGSAELVDGAIKLGLEVQRP
jgi:hypothetical protein